MRMLKWMGVKTLWDKMRNVHLQEFRGYSC